ncbi:hypothetical protein IW261DRAFT_176149 [Armillaria novae-zelandiae]|uniref:Uncharacterized protein n=1 Tax=Armillaria novae-zelandiae TaxID=153914 RepID=A0AA39NBS3_9AGAR|nr:hypothetical protein IW261DRAFT_176149 [Armillaria novae-zelandiae]
MLRMIAHCPAGQTLRASQPDRQDNLQHLRWFRSRTQAKLFWRRFWVLHAWPIPESSRHLHLTLHLNQRKNVQSSFRRHTTCSPQEWAACRISDKVTMVLSCHRAVFNSSYTAPPPLSTSMSTVRLQMYSSTPRECRHFLWSVHQQSIAMPSPTPSLTSRLESATRRHHLLVHQLLELPFAWTVLRG